MKRHIAGRCLRATILPALLFGSPFLGATGADVDAQDIRVPSRFDVGLFVGGAWTTPWLEAGDFEFGIGFNPIFGGLGIYWPHPRIGIRGHLSYMPSDMPEPDPPVEVALDDRRLHNWFYDLGIAFRPFVRQLPLTSPLNSTYFFVGAGGFTANPAGGDPDECVAPYDEGGACLSNDWRDNTVVQFTAGVGVPLIPLGRRLSIFTEAALHSYGSPFERAENWGQLAAECPECVAVPQRGLTTRLAGGLLLALGPAPPALVVLPPPAPPPPPPAERPIRICVVEQGIPRYIEAFVRPAITDTVVVEDGVRRPLREVYPPPAVASDEDWFIEDEDIRLFDEEYTRFGVVRTIDPEDLVRVAEYRGIPVFTITVPEPETPPGVIYVPVDDGCIFQPYQRVVEIRIRGV